MRSIIGVSTGGLIYSFTSSLQLHQAAEVKQTTLLLASPPPPFSHISTLSNSSHALDK